MGEGELEGFFGGGGGGGEGKLEILGKNHNFLSLLSPVYSERCGYFINAGQMFAMCILYHLCEGHCSCQGRPLCSGLRVEHVACSLFQMESTAERGASQY